MKIYVYQQGCTGNIEMVSKDWRDVYFRVWDDYCENVGKENAIEDFPDEETAFASFLQTGGFYDWLITEWEVE